MSPETAAYKLWDLFGLSWLIAAIWSSRSSARLGLRREAGHWLLFGMGFALLLGVHKHGPGGRPSGLPAPFNALTAAWWSWPEAVGWAQVALVAVGFAFAWWARLHLGRLWSGSVTRKEDHRIVDTGPYRWVRHPIYTGILLAALAQAGFRTSAAALLGFFLIAVSFRIKARLEEGFLRQELGADAYDAYSRRTPMLIPFAPFSNGAGSARRT